MNFARTAQVAALFVNSTFIHGNRSLYRKDNIVQGGFSLARNPKQISLYDVILAIEGPVAMNKCTVNKKSCSLSSSCKIHPIWLQVRKDIEKVLKRSTFESIKLSTRC